MAEIFKPVSKRPVSPDAVTPFTKEGENSEHPLRGFWLVRRSIFGMMVDPLKSIMDIPDTAYAESLSNTAGKIFSGDYLGERSKIEEWIRMEGEKKGLEVEVEHPLYFRLYPNLLTVGGTGWLFISLPAESIPTSKITFTLDDSFHNYAVLKGIANATTPRGLVPRVLSAAEIRYLVDSERFPEELDGRIPERYIEAQLWTQNLPILNRQGRL